MNSTILSLGLYEGSGGPSKSIRFFRDALSASVISWVDPKDAVRGRPVFSGATTVEGRFRKLLYAAPTACGSADELVQASDLVSCHSFFRYHNAWITRTAKRHRKPYWFVPHGSLDPWVLRQGRLSKKAFLAIWGYKFLAGASAFVFSTERERSKACRIFEPQKSRVIYWPLIDTDFCFNEADAAKRFRQRLRVNDEQFVLAYFGRLDPMKRPLETIRAFAKANLPNAVLVVAGNAYGVSEQECRDLSCSLGIESRVRVIGPIYGEEKKALLSACDAYISLSHRENFNYCAAESMAAGMPVILSEGNDLAWDLPEQQFCFRLTGDDVIASAAREIERIAAMSSEERGGRGEQGRKWAVENLQFDRFKSNVCGFAEEVIAEHRERTAKTQT